MIRFHNIDCMDFMREQPDKAFNLAIVDPPYFSGPEKLGFYGERTSKTGVFRKAYKKFGQWNVPGQEYFEELFRVSKNTIIFGINYYGILNPGPGRIVWDKCNDSSSFSDCEIAYCSMHDSVRIFRYMWNGMLQGKSIAEGIIPHGNKRMNEKRIHPTQKPVALYRWIFQTYWKSGWKVLDTHGGSMSIAIAAHTAGAELDICEIDKDYFAMGKQRVEEYTKQGQFDFGGNKT